MSEILLLVIALVLKLDALWADIKLDAYPMTKPNAIAFLDEIDSYYTVTDEGGEEISYTSVAPPVKEDFQVFGKT